MAYSFVLQGGLTLLFAWINVALGVYLFDVGFGHTPVSQSDTVLVFSTAPPVFIR
jgi:hypothetical protein